MDISEELKGYKKQEDILNETLLRLTTKAPVAIDWEEYHRTRTVWVPSEDVARYFSKQPPGLVLEVGCGQGLNVELLNGMGFDAYGIDSSYTAINKAASEKCLLEDLYSVKGSYKHDYVLDMECLTYLDEKAIDRVNRLLCVGGKLFSRWFVETSLSVGVFTSFYDRLSYLKKTFRKVRILEKLYRELNGDRDHVREIIFEAIK